MSSIQSVRQASYNALSGLNRAISRLDDVAQTVAEGIKNTSDDDGGTFSEKIAALASMPEISLNARANAKVLNAIEDLNAEFLLQPRR